MVEVNPSAPKPSGPGKGGGAKPDPILPGNKTFNPSAGGGGWGAYKAFLGEKGFKKFQTMLCQQISSQIQKNQAKEAKRKEVMKKSIEGKTDIYDD